MIFLLVGYMWLFVHRPFEIWGWMGTLHVERVYILFAAAFWCLFHHKHFNQNRIVVPLLVLIFAVFLSDYMNDFLLFGNKAIEDWSKVIFFIILLLGSVRSEKELKILITGFIIIFFIYMLHSYHEFRCGRYMVRMGIIRMIGVDEAMNDPNSFGSSVVLSLPMLTPLWCISKNNFIKILIRMFCVLYFALATLCVIKTGSRGSMVGLVFFLAMSTLFSKHRVRIILGIIFIFPIVWNTMDTSLQNRYLTLIDPSRGPKNAQESVEGRYEGVRNGIRLFKKSPIYGVGPGKSVQHSRIHLQAHNLFGQVIGEMGGFGLAAYIFLIAIFIVNYFAARYFWRISSGIDPYASDYAFYVAQSVFICVFLLLLLGLSGHNAFRYTWVWYAAFQALSVEILKQKVSDLVIQNEKCRQEMLLNAT